MAENRALVASATDSSVVQAIETYNRLQAVRNTLAPDLSDQELQLFAMVAERRGLDPFAAQIHAVKRQGRVTFQTGIDGYRSIAERTGQYGGSADPEYGPMLPSPYPHPEWARVVVRRIKGGQIIEQPATAYWDEYCPGGGQDHMWRKMPRNQIAKCAEALALRKAFPSHFQDVYVAEEMDQARSREVDEERAREIAAKPTAKDRIAARRAAVESQPVEQAADPAPEPVADVEPVEGELVEAAPDPGALTFGEAHPCKLHAVPLEQDTRGGWSCPQCRPTHR